MLHSSPPLLLAWTRPSAVVGQRAFMCFVGEALDRGLNGVCEILRSDTFKIYHTLADFSKVTYSALNINILFVLQPELLSELL